MSSSQRLASQAMASRIVEDIPSEGMASIFSYFDEDSLSKEAAIQEKALEKSLADTYNIPLEHVHWVKKIANEAAHVAVSGYRISVADEDLQGLLKSAGLEKISQEEGEALVSIAESILVKQAFRRPLDPIEAGLEAAPGFQSWMANTLSTFEKRAAIADKITEALASAGKKVSEAYNSPSLFGSVGRWAALGLPVAGGVGYIAGHGSGREAGRQDIADALAVRLAQIQEHYKRQQEGYESEA